MEEKKTKECSLYVYGSSCFSITLCIIRLYHHNYNHFREIRLKVMLLEIMLVGMREDWKQTLPSLPPQDARETKQVVGED